MMNKMSIYVSQETVSWVIILVGIFLVLDLSSFDFSSLTFFSSLLFHFLSVQYTYIHRYS